MILDNSVLISLVAADEESAYAESVFLAAQTGTRLMAPALCMFEFGSAVLTCVRRERMTLAEAWLAHERLEDLPIELSGGLSFAESSSVHRLALSSGLSFYDASYLMMAMVRCAKLATLDKALRTAAKALGIEVFE